MFDFLSAEKKNVILNHSQLGKPFFHVQIDKETFIQNLRTFSADLCNTDLTDAVRFRPREILGIVREIQGYPNKMWTGEPSILLDDLSRSLEAAKVFFRSRFNVTFDNGFISRNLTEQQIEGLHTWQWQTTIDSIQMPTETDFYRKVYLAVSLWRQEEQGRINYLLGKGIGVEIALQGRVLKRTKRPLRFNCRGHSDFEVYALSDMNDPYPKGFKAVFGAQEIFPLGKTKGLEGIPGDLLLKTSEVVEFGPIRIRIPELELLFLDKFMRPESYGLRSGGFDHELLAKQYVLNKNKALKYFDRFIAKFENERIRKHADNALRYHLSGIQRLFKQAKLGIEERGEILSKEAIIDRMEEIIAPVLHSDSSYGRIRGDCWVPISPVQIDDDGIITDALLIEQINSKIRLVNDELIRDLASKRSRISELLS